MRDAGDYIAALPKQQHDSAQWQLAIKYLMRAATDQVAWQFFARLAIMEVLYGKTPPPIGRDKRSKKRDQWQERRRERRTIRGQQ